ncbi:MAG: GNAT family N-acetyltransferase [Bacteroidales bacterium]|nr:GNAT family N-acetyltransferase [Bacteroidales bacterium]
MNRENLRLYKLSLDTIIKPFKCSEQELNGFLFEDAKRFQTELMAVTYIFEDIEADVTAAYYSLLADKISFNPEEKRMWNRINRKIPNSKRRRTYPAVKIGRLAVDERYASCGLGTDIITQIKYALTETRRIGCRFLTVDALSSAIPFYEKNGFLFFSESDKDEETRLMFYDLKNFML